MGHSHFFDLIVVHEPISDIGVALDEIGHTFQSISCRFTLDEKYTSSVREERCSNNFAFGRRLKSLNGLLMIFHMGN